MSLIDFPNQNINNKTSICNNPNVAGTWLAAPWWYDWTLNWLCQAVRIKLKWRWVMGRGWPLHWANRALPLPPSQYWGHGSPASGPNQSSDLATKTHWKWFVHRFCRHLILQIILLPTDFWLYLFVNPCVNSSMFILSRYIKNCVRIKIYNLNNWMSCG